MGSESGFGYFEDPESESGVRNFEKKDFFAIVIDKKMTIEMEN